MSAEQDTETMRRMAQCVEQGGVWANWVPLELRRMADRLDREAGEAPTREGGESTASGAVSVPQTDATVDLSTSPASVDAAKVRRRIVSARERSADGHGDGLWLRISEANSLLAERDAVAEALRNLKWRNVRRSTTEVLVKWDQLAALRAALGEVPE